MLTDQVRGLKAHGSSPAKGLREWFYFVPGDSALSTSGVLPVIVTPAKAGGQGRRLSLGSWVPAFAGTSLECGELGETMSDEGWIKAAKRGDLAAGDVLGIVIAGKEIALYDLDGTLHATDDVCTHAYAKLSDGWLDKGEIECPLHAGRFDIKTGKALCPPVTDDLKTYPVRLVGDEIQVKLD